jgi:hypothetical protein
MHMRRRIIETIIITIISSIPIFILIKVGFVAKTNSAMVTAYAVDAFIFYILNAFVLRGHLIAVKSVKKYFLANLLILAVHGAACVFAKKFMPNVVYEAFFGFTSLFCYLYMPRKLSVTIIYFLTLLEICFFPVDRFVQYKYYMNEDGKKEIR